MSRPETGYFEHQPTVTCAINPFGGGEHTFCGDAIDCASEDDRGRFSSHPVPTVGAWVERDCLVTCVKCRAVIVAARSVRLSRHQNQRRT
jgi:hypothetical protein